MSHKTGKRVQKWVRFKDVNLIQKEGDQLAIGFAYTYYLWLSRVQIIPSYHLRIRDVGWVSTRKWKLLVVIDSAIPKHVIYQKALLSSSVSSYGGCCHINKHQGEYDMSWRELPEGKKQRTVVKIVVLVDHIPRGYNSNYEAQEAGQPKEKSPSACRTTPLWACAWHYNCWLCLLLWFSPFLSCSCVSL